MVVVVVEVDVEFKEPLLESEEAGGMLTELVEFRQDDVTERRWV